MESIIKAFLVSIYVKMHFRVNLQRSSTHEASSTWLSKQDLNKDSTNGMLTRKGQISQVFSLRQRTIGN